MTLLEPIKKITTTKSVNFDNDTKEKFPELSIFLIFGTLTFLQECLRKNTKNKN